jgi:hypothetical protein
VSLRATLPASATGTITARVLIDSNVLHLLNTSSVGQVAVPLRAVSALPPVAVVGPRLTVDPWSRATLDGSASHDQNSPPALPLSFRWTFLSVPDGSKAALERDTTPQPTFWADLSGRYEVQLTVTNGLGIDGVMPAIALVDAVPTNAIRIELVWDHPDSDLDLHLIQKGGVFCDCATDCHYQDCSRHPNWFPDHPGSNPYLDHDARNGFGPENINIDGDGPSRFVVPGEYVIAVHYYSSNSGISTWPTKVSNATVRVFIGGLLAAELKHAMQTDGDLWVAGVIHWPEMMVTADGTVMMNESCGGL